MKTSMLHIIRADDLYMKQSRGGHHCLILAQRPLPIVQLPTCPLPDTAISIPRRNLRGHRHRPRSPTSRRPLHQIIRLGRHYNPDAYLATKRRLRLLQSNIDTPVNYQSISQHFTGGIAVSPSTPTASPHQHHNNIHHATMIHKHPIRRGPSSSVVAVSLVIRHCTYAAND